MTCELFDLSPVCLFVIDTLGYCEEKICLVRVLKEGTSYLLL